MQVASTTVFIKSLAAAGLLAALSGACGLEWVPTARGQDYGTGPHTYYLHEPSSYQQGC